MDLATDEKKKKTKRKIEDDQARKGIESLPCDIILDILSRLPITSLMQFRFINRAWNLLSYDPNLVALQFLSTATKNPYLIFHCDGPLRNQLCFTELSDNLENKIVRKMETPFCGLMPEFNLVASCYGLLCLHDSLYSDPVFIYNPFTRQYKELPRSRQYADQEVLFGFGFSIATNEFKVVKVVYYWNHYGEENRFPSRRLSYQRHTGSEVQVYSLGGNKWRSIGEVRYELERRASEAFVNGRLHWLTHLIPNRNGDRSYSYRNIVSFDLGTEKFDEIPRPDCGGLDNVNYHLAVLEGCLCAVVYKYQESFQIWVMTEYNVKESWVKEFVIQDYSKQFIRRGPQSSLWKSFSKQRDARLVCVLKNRNILMEYKCGVLVSHDPTGGTFQKIELQGVPNLLQTVVHVGSLTWI